jgi:type III secretion system FlhB-like substrate exporter
MALTTLDYLSTSTPASEVSSADFAARDDGSNGKNELAVPNFDDIMKNSPVAALLAKNKKEAEGSLPDDGEDVPTPDDEVDADPDDTSDADNDADADTEDDKSAEDESKDDESTQADLPKEEDIDWDYKLPVTVNGKIEYKTLAEVRKGFATDQHLSQKGRELGELKKQVEDERKVKLDELVQIGTVLHEEFTARENEMTAEYGALTAKIKKARDDGDTYTARDLKEKQEEIQEKYWATRNKREEQTKKVVEQLQSKQTEEQQKLIAQFQTDIKEVLPEFDEKLATSIRKFAIEEGIPEALLESVYSAKVVKFINEYRKLKTAKDVGAAKRKAAPVAKSVPTRRGTPAAQKQSQQNQQSRERVLSGQAGESEQLDFLKRISSVSRKL